MKLTITTNINEITRLSTKLKYNVLYDQDQQHVCFKFGGFTILTTTIKYANELKIQRKNVTKQLFYMLHISSKTRVEDSDVENK